MFNPVKAVVTLLLVGVVAVFAAGTPAAGPVLPLLPNDTPDNFKFTQQSFQSQLAAAKSKPQRSAPQLAAFAGNVHPSYLMEIASAAGSLMGTVDSTASYVEGSLTSTDKVMGWPLIAGGASVARSKVGEIALGLLAAYRHWHDDVLEQEIHRIAADLKADYQSNSGPLDGHVGLPFMADVAFMALYGEMVDSSEFSSTPVSGMVAAAKTLFDAVIIARIDVGGEVARIYGVRNGQGVPELTGYDVGLFMMAAIQLADARGDDAVYLAYAQAALDSLNGLEASMGWEATNPGSNTNNVLSWGIVLAGASMLGDASASTFSASLIGNQVSGGTLNGYSSDGSFLPAGNIYSNSWAIMGLREYSIENNNPTVYLAAMYGCKYLAETQDSTFFSWVTYPLFNDQAGQWFVDVEYPHEAGAALAAICQTAWFYELNLEDRESTTALKGIAVEVVGTFSADTFLTVTDDSGSVYVTAILDTAISVSLTFDSVDHAYLQGFIIGSFDASLVLEQSLKDSPFGADDAAYGSATEALASANLTAAGGFTSANISSQIAAEILAYAVGNSPLVMGTAEYDLLIYPSLTSITSPSITLDYPLEDIDTVFSLILPGDISNNLATAGGPGYVTTLLAGSASVGSPLRLSLAGYLMEEGKLLVPIVLSQWVKGIEAPGAFQFDFSYNQSLVTYSGLRLGEQATGFVYAENDTEPGLVRVAMASGGNVKGNGVIAYLVFTPLQDQVGLESFALGNALIDEKRVASEIAVPLEVFQPNSLAKNAVLPRAFALAQNSPNPFNPSTTIQYSIPESGGNLEVKLTVFNIRGQQVKTLVDLQQVAGTYKVQWDGVNQQGRKVPSGVYFYRLRAGDFSQTRKMIILK